LENNKFVKYKKHTVDKAAVKPRIQVIIIDLIFSGNLWRSCRKIFNFVSSDNFKFLPLSISDFFHNETAYRQTTLFHLDSTVF